MEELNQYDLLLKNITGLVLNFNKVYNEEITVLVSPAETYISDKDGIKLNTQEFSV